MCALSGAALQFIFEGSSCAQKSPQYMCPCVCARQVSVAESPLSEKGNARNDPAKDDLENARGNK